MIGGQKYNTFIKMDKQIQPQKIKNKVNNHINHIAQSWITDSTELIISQPVEMTCTQK